MAVGELLERGAAIGDRRLGEGARRSALRSWWAASRASNSASLLGEVVVEGALADADRGRHVAQAGAEVALVSEEVERGVEDGLAGALAIGVLRACHSKLMVVHLIVTVNRPGPPGREIRRRTIERRFPGQLSYDQAQPEGVMEDRRKAAWIGGSILVKGDVVSTEDLVIDGQVQGTIELGDHSLTIGQGASVVADLVAKMRDHQRQGPGQRDRGGESGVEVDREVEGDITAPTFVMEDGAALSGQGRARGTPRQQVAWSPPFTADFCSASIFLICATVSRTPIIWMSLPISLVASCGEFDKP